MKRIIIYITLILVFTFLGIIGIRNQPKDLPDNDILNKELYLYNINTGIYETLKITPKSINYVGSSLDLTNCKTYTYNAGTSIIKLDCNKAIRIIGKVNNSYVFKINNKNIFFYDKKENSFGGEFQRTYNTTYENYITDGITKITPLNLNYTSLTSLLTTNNTKILYIKTDNCKETCNIYNNIFAMDKTLNNKHYLDTETLSLEEKNNIYTINQVLGNLINSSTKYPIIVEINNNIITNNYNIEVDGINFEKYINSNIISEVPNE